MKRLFSRVAVCFWIIGLFCGVNPAQADAGDYIGDFCWDYSGKVDGTTVTALVQLGFNHIGGGHYLCSGTIKVTSPLTFQMPAFGNAEFLDDGIHVTLQNQGRRFDSQGHYTVGSDMSTIILDPRTFNGVTKGIGIYYDDIELSEGTVTLRSCP